MRRLDFVAHQLPDSARAAHVDEMCSRCHVEPRDAARVVMYGMEAAQTNAIAVLHAPPFSEYAQEKDAYDIPMSVYTIEREDCARGHDLDLYYSDDSSFVAHRRDGSQSMEKANDL